MLSGIAAMLGWAGAILILLAYWLLVKDWLTHKSFYYHFINFCGCLLLILANFSASVYSMVFLNVIFLCIALIGIRNAQRY